MQHSPKYWQRYLHRVITGTDTPAGWLFDVLLILTILLNTLLIIVESVESIRLVYGGVIASLQYFFLAVFTIEFILRVMVAPNRRAYLTSFFGIIDLLAILPFYLVFIVPVARLFPVLRILRLLRLFAVFKMVRYVEESGTLVRALRASRTKITIFVVTILFIVIIVGALMYTVEGPEHGFTNIPESMYWAIVTVSTVGYGDVSPQTELGKLISSVLMVVGYGIIAVPTGIITSELSYASREFSKEQKGNVCLNCGQKGHPSNASFCYQCGEKLR